MSVVELTSTKRFRRKDGSLSPKVTVHDLLKYKLMLDAGQIADPNIKLRYKRSWLKSLNFFEFSLMVELEDE